jgi:hypothetical protein
VVTVGGLTTVRTAGSVVMSPVRFVNTARKRWPLSPVVVAGVV